jgi:hypothetical protein
MSPAPRRPGIWRLPDGGVLRVHYDPGALPAYVDTVGPHRFDDPRPRTADRYVMRYTATTLRGCLLELLAWLRPHPDAVAREAAIIGDADGEGEKRGAPIWQALEDFLRGRQVGVLLGPDLRLVSIDDPVLQAQLDPEPAVRALLDSPQGSVVLAPSGGTAHLDEAAIRLSTGLGRALTQACSLALRDRDPRPDGIHYRSRHDDAEDCWALYDHAPVDVARVTPLDPGNEEQRKTLQDVAALWDLPLPPDWS